MKVEDRLVVLLGVIPHYRVAVSTGNKCVSLNDLDANWRLASFVAGRDTSLRSTCFNWEKVRLTVRSSWKLTGFVAGRDTSLRSTCFDWEQVRLTVRSTCWHHRRTFFCAFPLPLLQVLSRKITRVCILSVVAISAHTSLVFKLIPLKMFHTFTTNFILVFSFPFY